PLCDDLASRDCIVAARAFLHDRPLHQWLPIGFNHEGLDTSGSHDAPVECIMAFSTKGDGSFTKEKSPIIPCSQWDFTGLRPAPPGWRGPDPGIWPSRCASA